MEKAGDFGLYSSRHMLQVSEIGPVTRIRMARSVMGRPIHGMSAYLVDGLLVDTGPAVTAGRILEALESRRPEAIVLTHHHEDHAGAAGLVSSRFGIPVFAHGAAIGMLAEGARMPLYRRVLFGTPRAFRAEPLGQALACGGRRWEVITTPGHAPDHVCLIEREEGWAFTGDLFVDERTRLLRGVEDVWAQMDSLRRVAACGPRTLFCAQSGPVQDAAAAMMRKVAYLERLAEEADRLRRDGLTDRQITRRLLGREGFLTLISLWEFSKIRLVRALLYERPGSDGEVACCQ